MTSNNVLDLHVTVTNGQETLDVARLIENSFTRKRGMSFPEAISFMLDMRKTTLQTRLNLYFHHVKGGDPISQQAFSKLRMNFDHSPFEKMLRLPVKHEYSGQYELPLWHGYHIFAIDGSYLQLPRVDILRNEFGVRGRGGTCPCAGMSVLFDVLHGWALDPIITGANMNERVECGKHIDFLCREMEHIAKNSIILLDRGYPSLDLFEKLQNSGLKFLARCCSQSMAEINNAPMGNSVVTLKNDVSVRVFKFMLPSGEIETLVTNLFEMPDTKLPELYSLRWGIEVAYFRLKRQICIEKFSGKTPNSIRQDFWASMTLLNTVAVFQKEADEAVQKRQSTKAVKHKTRARTSGVIVTLRDRFIFSVLCGSPKVAEREMECVINAMSREVSPVRPNRSYPRTPKPHLVVNHNLKSCL